MLMLAEVLLRATGAQQQLGLAADWLCATGAQPIGCAQQARSSSLDWLLA
jgi:hypothetical protein